MTAQISDGNTNEAKSLGGSILLANSGAGLYFLTTAVTANSTTTTAAAGSISVTTSATGNTKLFISDGSKWQYAVVA